MDTEVYYKTTDSLLQFCKDTEDRLRAMKGLNIPVFAIPRGGSSSTGFDLSSLNEKEMEKHGWHRKLKSQRRVMTL